MCCLTGDCRHCRERRGLAPLAVAPEPTIYVNADRTILLTVHVDGTHELALRDESRRWGPPIALQPERADAFVNGTGLAHEHDAYKCKQAGCLPVAVVES